VTDATRTPICTGENLYRKYGFRDLIEKQAVEIIAPDIPKMGGLLEAKKVADLADMYCMPVAPHNVASPIGTVAAAHVCAAMSNFLVRSTTPMMCPGGAAWSMASRRSPRGSSTCGTTWLATA
jgi:L-alanine-DL-glutamate epimerase-like enolase superfamily enzyme